MKQENLSHIKALFEAKTGVQLRRSRPGFRPLRRAVLAAAAVLCCLGVTALAANHLTHGALIRFFQDGGAFGRAPSSQGAPGPLNEAQLLTLDRYTTEVNETQTVGGTTITLETVTAAATTHDLIGYCVFEVEAPAGSWTEAHNDILGFEHYYCDLEGDTTQYCSTSWLRVLDDPQGRDNVKTMVAAYLVNAQGDNRHLTLRIDLENFWACADRQAGAERITEGTWTFEIPLELQEGVSLLDAPIPLAGGARTLSCLELTPLGGSIVVSLPALPRDQWAPEQVVFSDGSTVEINLEGGLHDEEAGVDCLGFTFAAPTDLTGAVAVEFADGTRVPLP